jgi:serine/threonine protein kinase
MSEINIWAKLEHDNIVRYKSSWIEIGDWTRSNENDTSIVKNQEILYIQMELCQMTLRKAFTQICKEFNQNHIRGMTIIGAYISSEIFIDILEGVNFLHTRKPPILHRDLKLSNILVINSAKGFIAKLSDFGLSTIHGASVQNINDVENLDIDLRHSRGCGTFKYMAVEVKSGKYDTSADMYSLGVILCELFCIKFEEVDKLDEKYFESHKFKALKQVKLMKNLLQEWASKRPNCDKLLSKKIEWAVPFEDIIYAPELREITYWWWQKIFNKFENEEQISATILMNKCAINVRENLRLKNSQEKRKSPDFNEINAMRDVFEEKVRSFEEITNISDENLKENIFKILLHGMNISDGFDELCYFMEMELMRKLSKYFHCFSTSYSGPVNILNWFETPYYIISFFNESENLIIRVVLINTQMGFRDIDHIEDMQDVNPLFSTFSDEINPVLIKLCFTVIDHKTNFKSITEMQNFVTESLKNAYKGENWNCYISENEVISWYYMFSLPEKCFAARFSTFCIIIVDESFEVMSEKTIIELNEEFLSSIDENDSNVIKSIFHPQFINSRLVLKRIKLKDNNICFIRVSDDFKFTQKRYTNYRLHQYNIQLFKFPFNEGKDFDPINCSEKQRKIIRRNIMSEEETKLELTKFYNFKIDQINFYEEMIDCSKTFRKLIHNNILADNKDENSSKLFQKMILSLLDFATDSADSRTSWKTSSDETKDFQYVLLQTIDYYIKTKEDESLEGFFALIMNKYLELLKSDDDNICFYALSAFDVMLRHCKLCFQRCYETDLLNQVMALIKPNKSLVIINEVIEVIGEFVVNLNKQKLTVEEIKKILLMVNLLIDHPDEKIALSMIQLVRSLDFSIYNRQFKDLILECLDIPKFINLLANDSQQVRQDAMHYLGFILSDSLEGASMKFDSGILDKEIYGSLANFLNLKFDLKVCALVIISLIVFENESCIQTLIDSNLLPLVIELINKENNVQRILAIKTIHNIVKICNKQQFLYIYEKDFIQHLSDSLKFFADKENGTNVCVFILDILFALLTICKEKEDEIFDKMVEFKVFETIRLLEKYDSPDLNKLFMFFTLIEFEKILKL